MVKTNQTKPKPLICTFRELAQAFYPLHLGSPADVLRLHDIWQMGAITPDSRVLLPNHFDERLHQPGNVVRRIVLPTPLATWVQDIAARRGLPMTRAEALRVAHGTYEVPINPRIVKP